MIFNSKVITTGLLLSCVLGLTSCSDFLKGKPKKQSVIEAKDVDVSCVKDVQSDFKKLIDAKSTEADIDKSFACINKTLEQFKNKVEGRANANSFTSEELFTIFNIFFKDAAISQKATDDILILKKALLGGPEDSVTKTELDALKEYLKYLQVEVKNLSPYIKVFTFKKENGPFDTKTLKMAFSQLRASLKTLLNASKIGRSQYNFEDVKQLTTSLNIVEPRDQDLITLVENVINLLSGTAPLESEAEYTLAIDNFVDLAELYSEAMFTDIKFEITEKNQLNQVMELAQRLIKTLENSLQYKKTKIIPTKFLDPIIAEILKSQVVELDVSESTFINFYKIAMIRVFNDQKDLAPESFVGLKEINFKNIKRELFVYKMYQEFINSIDFSSNPSITAANLKTKITAYNFGTAMVKTAKQNLGLDAGLQKQIILGLEEFRQEAISSRPILYREKKMMLAINQNMATVNWEDLSRALFTKMLAREMMLGWGQLDPQFGLYKSTITEPGMIKWYADFKQFGVEVKLFDPRTVNNGAKNFLEANLFTYYGNGDKAVDYFEILQYVNMLLSGGGENTTVIQQDMIKAGCALKEIDLFGNPWLDEKCFVKQLRKNTKVYFSHIFNFSTYLERLNDQQFQAYYDDLMTVARTDDKMKGKIETADVRTLTMLAMYIEALYGRYDLQQPAGTFSPAEIRSSFPRFKGFVTDYAETSAKETLEQWDKFYNICSYSYNKEDLYREAFIFMVYNGKLPVLEDMNYITCGANGLFTFTGEVDRKTIISTFKVLKTVLASKDAVKN